MFRPRIVNPLLFGSLLDVEVLLGMTTHLEPFALLRTFERAVDIVVAGSVTIAGARGGTRGFPAPALDVVASDGLLHPEEPQGYLPDLFRRSAVEDTSVVHVQVIRCCEKGRSFGMMGWMLPNDDFEWKRARSRR